MNKLYLLLSLALSTEATSPFLSTASYAGDCFSSLKSTLGALDSDCGDSCYSNWFTKYGSSITNGTSNNGTTDNTGKVYHDCYYDYYGEIATDKAVMCNNYAQLCDEDSTCLQKCYFCYGDETCLMDAVCNGSADCESSVASKLGTRKMRLTQTST